MNSLLRQLGISLRLYYRNKMGLIYNYLLGTIFLVALWAYYRYEQTPLIAHVGQLLTVTALGGACFGLPTSMVSDRERGVWRRFRLAPVPTAQLVASTVIARYLLLLSAGLLQILIAMAIGMPAPPRPLQLLIAFTFVCFAFMGLGLVIAMLADNVPAVQALGQTIFLPMLIIGGVMVRLERLPEWARHVSAFFPGRYAVESIQATVTGDGLPGTPFALIALALIGAAGFIAGSKMFRWDAMQRFSTRGGKAWLGVALGAWVAVGVLAETTGFLERAGLAATATQDGERADLGAVVRTAPDGPAQPIAAADSLATDSVRVDSVAAPRDTARTSLPLQPGADPPATAGAPPAAQEPAPTSAPAQPRGPWDNVTLADIDRDLVFDRLPPDDGVVTPVAVGGYAPFPETECLRSKLPEWVPGLASDPVQRVRNLLYVATVPDLYQMEDIERNTPYVVFDRIRLTVARDDLAKILYWIALHPSEGSDAAADQLRGVCLDISGPSDQEELRNRTAIYAVKLLGRVLGKEMP